MQHATFCLASFTHHVFQVRLHCSKWQHVMFLWIIFHCVDRPLLFIHSSAGGHLRCFHFLATMSNAPIIICVHVFCERAFSVLFSIFLGAELLSHVVTLCLGFQEKAKLFSGTAFCTPTRYLWGFPIFAVFTSVCYVPFFGNLTGCVMVSHSGSDLHFPNK